MAGPIVARMGPEEIGKHENKEAWELGNGRELGEEGATEYACALSDSRGGGLVAVWLPGRLQVTLRSLCFTSDGREVQQPFSQVEAITKSPSLPSAIEIRSTAPAERLLLSGFSDVDQALVHLQRAWRGPPPQDQLKEDMKQEVQSALALCRAALEHCRGEQGDLSPFDRDEYHNLTVHSQEMSSRTGKSLVHSGGDSRSGCRANKKETAMDYAAVSAAWGATWLTKHNGTVRSVAVSPCLNLVASASGDHLVHLSQLPPVGLSADAPDSPEGSVQHANGGQGAVAQVLGGHRHIVSGIAFSSDGSLLVSSSHDKTLRVWARHAAGDQVNRQEGEREDHQQTPWRLCAVLEGHMDAVSCVALPQSASQDTARASAHALDLPILSGSADGTLVLWRMTLVCSPPVQAGAQGLPPQRQLLVAPTALHFSVPCPASPNAHGQYLAEQTANGTGACEGDGMAFRADVLWSGSCEARWLPTCHRDAVTTCAWLHDSGRFVSGAADGTVAMCSAGEGGGCVLWRSKVHTRRVVASVVSSSGTRVVSCSEDSRLLVYDSIDGQVTQTLDMGTALALSLAWGVDEECVLVATGGKRIKVFHLASSCALGSLKLPLLRDGEPQRVTSIAWDPAQRGMVLGLADFSVVYLQRAAKMVRRAVVGCCARKGLAPPRSRAGAGGAVSLGSSQLFASHNSSSRALFSSVGSSAPSTTTATLHSLVQPGPRPYADVGEPRDMFLRRSDSAEGESVNIATGKKRSVPIVLPTHAPKVHKSEEGHALMTSAQSQGTTSG